MQVPALCRSAPKRGPWPACCVRADASARRDACSVRSAHASMRWQYFMSMTRTSVSQCVLLRLFAGCPVLTWSLALPPPTGGPQFACEVTRPRVRFSLCDVQGLRPGVPLPGWVCWHHVRGNAGSIPSLTLAWLRVVFCISKAGPDVARAATRRAGTASGPACASSVRRRN